MTRLAIVLQIAGFSIALVTASVAGLVIVRRFMKEGNRARTSVVGWLSWSSLVFFVGWIMFLVGGLLRRP